MQHVAPYDSTTVVSDLTDFDRMYNHVQDYLHFKDVNTELLICAIHYRVVSVQDQYDWSSFVSGVDPGTSQHKLRVALQTCV